VRRQRFRHRGYESKLNTNTKLNDESTLNQSEKEAKRNNGPHVHGRTWPIQIKITALKLISNLEKNGLYQKRGEVNHTVKAVTLA